MNSPILRETEASVLYTLRRSKTARFSELMRPTGLESDVFKFHLRRLLEFGYVEKLISGEYQLTAPGKEFANNLDKKRLAIQKQPKLSLYMVVSRQAHNGKTEYLLQQRLRNPFYGYWGCITGPAQWGTEFEETATYELEKQTGLHASFIVRSFLRTRDFTFDTKSILEDKLFIILQADQVKGQVTDSWTGGHNQWMTLDGLKEQDSPYFESTEQVLAMLQANNIYGSSKQIYDPKHY